MAPASRNVACHPVLGSIATGIFALAAASCGSGTAELHATASETASALTAVKPPGHGRPSAFQAEGTVNPAWVLPPAVPPLPDGLEFRARYVYPASDDCDELELTVFVTAVGAPTMLPLTPPSVVSQLRAKVDRFRISRDPGPNLLISGTVRSTPVPSPFGPQIGRLISVTAGFQEGAVTTFSLLAGTVAGSHATTLPTATGTLAFERED